MIKIKKEYEVIPHSLMPPTESFFLEEKPPKTSHTTHEVRIKMAKNGKYDDSANPRYKLKDVKHSLVHLYDSRCAYCGCYYPQEMLEVEHYRPKNHYQPDNQKKINEHQNHNGYYWLSLSWDNLLLSCRNCNGSKSSIFDIEDKDNRATYSEEAHKEWSLIHKLSGLYDDQEKPLLINPEKEDPIPHFSFSKNGHVKWLTEKGKNTLNVCNLDRDDLVEKRAEIIEDFETELIDLANNYRDRPEAFLVFSLSKIESFRKITNKPKRSFVAFREQAIKDCWLIDITRNILDKAFIGNRALSKEEFDSIVSKFNQKRKP